MEQTQHAKWTRTPQSSKSLIWLAREDAGLTRVQVAAILDPPISPKTLERWERGQTQITYQRLRQLALVYRVQRSSLAA